MPDLGKYADTVLTAYAASIALLVVLIVVTLRRSRNTKRDLEIAEKLEQLRMLEHGFKIKIVVSDFESISVDTPEDLERARKYYQKFVKKI